MRFGLIGDVHAEDERLRIAIDAITHAKVDHILCTGDLVDGHGDADRAIALLATRRVVTIRGNHDRWIKNDEMRTLPNAHRMTGLAPSSIEFLKSLEPTRSFDVPGGKLLLCHGVGKADMRQLNPDDSGYAISSNNELLEILFDPKIVLMVCGHTHKPMVRRFERGSQQPPLVVVNAGTLARDHESGFVIVDVVAKRADFFRIGDDLSVKASSRAVL